MEWTSDTGGQTYTTKQESCQALVWRTMSREWNVLVSGEGSAVGHETFTTLEDAQAWCEAQLAELAAAGQCSKDVL